MRWLLRPTPTAPSRLARVRAVTQLRRSSTTPDFEIAEVRCGSSGSIPISYAPGTLVSAASHTDHPSLHNAAQTTLPLLIYIPPSPSPSPPSPTSLPPLLQPYPTAMIHYRWSATPPPPTSGPPTPHHWPTPLHDVSFAYAHIATHLSPPYPSRRPIFILSSHAGASLATSLALTEAHPHRHFAVRGLAVYNGVFNWSMFLPDHRVHQDDKATPGCAAMDELGRLTPGLFRKPANLFDPFASPSLFFRTAGLDTPPSFTPQTDDLASLSEDAPEPPARLRRAALIFPPRTSTLKIPETHLLYTRPPPPPGHKRRANAKVRGNTFEAQAVELAGLMRRSVEREVKERMAWDDEADGELPYKRVRTYDLGEADGGEMGAAEGVVSRWLWEKFGF